MEGFTMASKPNRYKVFERNMTYSLCIDAMIFIFYMIAAGNGIGRLKVILTLMCLALSAYILWSLYCSNELLKQRSLWMTVGAGAIAICLLFSLILNFPSPNKYKIVDNESAFTTNQVL